MVTPGFPESGHGFADQSESCRRLKLGVAWRREMMSSWGRWAAISLGVSWGRVEKMSLPLFLHEVSLVPLMVRLEKLCLSMGLSSVFCMARRRMSRRVGICTEFATRSSLPGWWYHEWSCVDFTAGCFGACHRSLRLTLPARRHACRPRGSEGEREENPRRNRRWPWRIR